MWSSHCEPVKLIYNFKSKGVKGKYIDDVSLYPTVMYYDRYPVGHITKNCVCLIYKKKETTQLHKALDILLFSAAQGLQNATKIN